MQLILGEVRPREASLPVVVAAGVSAVSACAFLKAPGWEPQPLTWKADFRNFLEHFENRKPIARKIWQSRATGSSLYWEQSLNTCNRQVSERLISHTLIFVCLPLFVAS